MRREVLCQMCDGEQIAEEARRSVIAVATRTGGVEHSLAQCRKGSESKKGCGFDTVAAAFVAEFAHSSAESADDGLLRTVAIGSGCRSVGHQRATHEIYKAVHHPHTRAHPSAAASGSVDEGDSSSFADAFISGFVLFDCHAEVMAKRAFNAYLLSEMEVGVALIKDARGRHERIEAAVAEVRTAMLQTYPQFILLPAMAASKDTLVFAFSPLLRGIHLWVSQPPCGDCSIVVDTDTKQVIVGTGAHVLLRTDAEAMSYRVSQGCDAELPPSLPSFASPWLAACEEDAKRIASHFCASCGRHASSSKHSHASSPLEPARCVWGSDDKADGCCAYPYSQTAVGFARTKPGAGVPTLSMSCTEKVARWMHEGLCIKALATLFGEAGSAEKANVAGPLTLSRVIIDAPNHGEDGGPDFQKRLSHHTSALERGLKVEAGHGDCCCEEGRCIVSQHGIATSVSSASVCLCSSFLGSPIASVMWRPPPPKCAPALREGEGRCGYPLRSSSPLFVTLNTKLGVPMGTTLASIKKALQKHAQGLGGKRDRDENSTKSSDGALQASPAAAEGTPIGNIVPHAFAHEGTRYSMCQRVHSIANEVGALFPKSSLPAAAELTTYQALKQRGLSHSKEVERTSLLGKGRARDFKFV